MALQFVETPYDEWKTKATGNKYYIQTNRGADPERYKLIHINSANNVCSIAMVREHNPVEFADFESTLKGSSTEVATVDEAIQKELG